MIYNQLPISAIVVASGLTNSPYVYVVDSGNNRIQVFDYNGNFKFSFGSFGNGNGQFINPYGIAFDGLYLYVTDSGNDRIQIFDSFGNYIDQFGMEGSAPGQFNNPLGIAVDNKFIYVVDSDNDRFQVFTKGPSYKCIFYLGSFGPGVDQFDAPTDCSVDATDLYITDTGNNRIVIYPLNFEAYYENIVSFVLPQLLTMAFNIQSAPVPSPIKLSALISEMNVKTIIGSAAEVSMVFPAPTFTINLLGGIIEQISMKLPQFMDMNFQGSIGTQAELSFVLNPLISTDIELASGTLAQVSIPFPSLGLIVNIINNPATSKYKALVMNLELNALTEYPDYAFTGFFMFQGKAYGVSDVGIFPLNGPSDNGTPIHVKILSGDFDSEAGTQSLPACKKRPNEAFLLYRSNGALKFSLWGNRDGNYQYQITHERIKLGQGFNSRFFRWGIENKNGASLELGNLRILWDLITTKKR